MRPGGIALIVLGMLAAVVGFVLPVRADGEALAGLAATDQSLPLTGTITEQLNQEALIQDPANPYDVGVPIRRDVVAVADVEASELASQEAGVSLQVLDTRTTTTRTDTGEELSVAGAVYPFDPGSSELVSCCGASVNGNVDVQLQGIVPVKFPFDTEAGTYQMFSPALLTPTPVTYVDDVEEYGLRLMRFAQEIPATQTPAAPLNLPAGLAAGLVGQVAPQLADRIPADGDVALYEFYAASTTFLVEAQTGRIVDITSAERTTYRLNGGDADIVTKVATNTTGADPAQVAAAVAEAAKPLLRAERLFPWLVGGGLLAVVAGVVFVVLGGRRTPQPQPDTAQRH